MKDLLKTASEQYGEGLITDREFLGKVIEIVGNQWQQMSEMDNCTNEVVWLAGCLD